MRDTQRLASVFGIFAIAPIPALSLLTLFPSSVVWAIFSIFPFSAPVLVMLRLGTTGVPAVQVVASIAVLVASIVAGIELAGKLLRMYLLNYGKRPALRQIISSLRRD